MALLVQYLLKLSISLAIVWLFYQFVLRKLTFYNANRWYLAGYTVLSFLIPFINITPVLEESRFAGHQIVRVIPAVERYATGFEEATVCPSPIWSTAYDKWDWIALGLLAGAAIFLLRFVTRCISFFRIRRKARLISAGEVKVYHLNENIIPFSFGNAVFINSHLHTEAELQEIICHEFVHAKQKHTLDILWSEWLCIINWYNPFAWLLKASIRQNLEFIADHKVLENGLDKKQYQYLLLKVIGNNQFSIASQFNFSSLKKRIAMMNKMKTARMHLLRFLFILPLLAVILISFRQKQRPVIAPAINEAGVFAVADTIPDVTEPNEKGYIINIKDNKDTCTVVVKDKSGKQVKRLLLTDWNKNAAHYEDLYGDIPVLLPPAPPAPPAVPGTAKLPGNVNEINVHNDKATVQLKDGTKETYDMSNDAQKAAFEKKYGKLPAPPAPPAVPGTAKLPGNVNEINVHNDKATVQLKDGTKETYDMSIDAQKAAFEKKYGKLPVPPAPPVPPAKPVSLVEDGDGVTVTAPMAPLAVAAPGDAMVGDMPEGVEDVLVVINKKTTRQQLDDFIRQMKEKDVELKFDNIDYNDGILVSISGTMKSKDGQSNFVATDFSKLTLSMVRNGENSWFRVKITKNRVVI